MSVTILDQLENKIKQAVETIQLLQLEVEELKGKNEGQLKRMKHYAKSMSNSSQSIKISKNVCVLYLVKSTMFNM